MKLLQAIEDLGPIWGFEKTVGSLPQQEVSGWPGVSGLQGGGFEDRRSGMDSLAHV